MLEFEPIFTLRQRMKNLTVQEKKDLDDIVFNALAKSTKAGFFSLLWAKLTKLLFKDTR